MIDLWTLLVVDMFQGFWLAMLAICLVMWLIMVIGKVSQVTSINFLSIFMLAMCISYGSVLITILLTIGILVIQLLAIPRLVNS